MKPTPTAVVSESRPVRPGPVSGAGAEGPGPSTAADEGPGGDPPREAAARVEAERQRRVADGAKASILPDFCNPGIALRTVLPVNAAALVVAIGASNSLRAALSDFVDLAMVLEPVLLGSMLILCLVRKVVNGWPRPWQWAVALSVPGGLGALVAIGAYPVLTAGPAQASPVYWVLARTLLAVVGAYAVIEALRWRSLAYSPSLAEARLQALQARIRPHFLFNSLNTVLGLMRSEPRSAERTLEDLADLFRVFMRDTRELIALEEEVVTCQQYLAIEQLRLGGRLNVRWHLEDMPGDALLPSLLLQPLLENSVHHGIEPSTESGDIEIRISKPGERVRVQIVNPICSVAPTRPGNQMALSNVRERLMLLYDVEAELRTSSDGQQFTLFLEFPYRKERRRRDVRRHFNPDR